MELNQTGYEPGLPIAAPAPLAARHTPATPLPPQPTNLGAVLVPSKASHTGNVRRPWRAVQRLVLTALANSEIAKWSNAEVARLIGVSASSVDRQRGKQPDLRPKLPVGGTLRLCRRGKVVFSMNVAGIGGQSRG
jgi:hypothetical protein